MNSRQKNNNSQSPVRYHFISKQFDFIQQELTKVIEKMGARNDLTGVNDLNNLKSTFQTIIEDYVTLNEIICELKIETNQEPKNLILLQNLTDLFERIDAFASDIIEAYICAKNRKIEHYFFNRLAEIFESEASNNKEKKQWYEFLKRLQNILRDENNSSSTNHTGNDLIFPRQLENLMSWMYPPLLEMGIKKIKKQIPGLNFLVSAHVHECKLHGIDEGTAVLNAIMMFHKDEYYCQESSLDRPNPVYVKIKPEVVAYELIKLNFCSPLLCKLLIDKQLACDSELDNDLMELKSSLCEIIPAKKDGVTHIIKQLNNAENVETFTETLKNNIGTLSTAGMKNKQIERFLRIVLSKTIKILGKDKPDTKGFLRDCFIIELDAYKGSREMEKVEKKTQYRSWFGRLFGFSADTKIAAAKNQAQHLLNCKIDPKSARNFAEMNTKALFSGQLGKIVSYYQTVLEPDKNSARNSKLTR